MKKSIVALVISLSALQAVAFATLKNDPVYREARLSGAQAKIELCIADDDGTPVPDAKIKAYLGMNFRPRGTWVNGVTDTNGVFVLEGKTCGDEIEVFVTKDGYYDSRVVYCYAKMGEEHDVKDGKWQPYGEKRRIRLRIVKNPKLGATDARFADTKRLNEWIGYDLEKHDFIAPFGCGKDVDFMVSIDWDGKWLPTYSGMGVRVRFVDEYSGYYVCNVCEESEFKGPYNSDPDAIYKKEARFYEEIQDGGKRSQHLFDRSKCWVVRSRCKVDSNGHLIKANYSIVHYVGFCGDVDGTGGFRAISAFNPTPNDTNLEPKHH